VIGLSSGLSPGQNQFQSAITLGVSSLLNHVSNLNEQRYNELVLWFIGKFLKGKIVYSEIRTIKNPRSKKTAHKPTPVILGLQ
jgi:hypothetical protein